MKSKPGRPSPAMAVALATLFLAVGGNVVAYGLGRNSVHSRDIAPRVVDGREEHEVTLSEEEIVVEKKAVPKERSGLTRRPR